VPSAGRTAISRASGAPSGALSFREEWGVDTYSLTP
jgi:hypothetical protein